MAVMPTGKKGILFLKIILVLVFSWSFISGDNTTTMEIAFLRRFDQRLMVGIDIANFSQNLYENDENFCSVSPITLISLSRILALQVQTCLHTFVCHIHCGDML